MPAPDRVSMERSELRRLRRIERVAERVAEAAVPFVSDWRFEGMEDDGERLYAELLSSIHAHPAAARLAS